MNERERKRHEVKDKGIPIADIGAEVIWDDPKLKVPFTSDPFISRMKGSAVLGMALSFGLYFNELSQKWMPITSATMTESMVKSRYYPTPPSALSELSDNPMRSDLNQNLMVVNKDVPLKVSDLAFLDITKLSVKDVDLNALITTIDGVLDTIQAQTDKLTFDVSNNLKCIIG